MLTTRPLLEVAKILVAEPDREHFMRGLAAETGLATGTTHSVLTRLREAQWIADTEQRPAQPSGYPRQYFRVTELGQFRLKAMLDKEQERRARLTVVA